MKKTGDPQTPARPMEICFYLPGKYLPDPQTARLWERNEPATLHQSGKIAAAQCWVWQTWMELKKAGLEVPLVHVPPEKGVMISLGGFFGERHRPPPGVLFVAIAADWKPHPLADWHILQNGRQHQLVPRSTYIPLWTQPGMIPRAVSRGDTVRVAAFQGDPVNLAGELQSPAWRRAVAEIGIEFQIRNAARWHDYSDVDISVGVRSFGFARHHHKPPTKLFNAWLAGVPFIGGHDSAYRYERKSPLDYLPAASARQLLDCLRRLRADPSLWRAMRDNALKRSADVSRLALAARWKAFLTGELPAIHGRWMAENPAKRAARLLQQRLRLALTERLIRFIP